MSLVDAPLSAVAPAALPTGLPWPESPLLALDPASGLALLAQAPYGEYLLWWKLLPFVLVFLVWIQLLLWIDKDTLANRLPREPINAGLWALLLAGMVAVLMVPMFVVALAIFVALFALSIGGYLIWRNSVVGLSDIPEQTGLWFKNLFRSKKVKRYEKKEEAVAEGMITLMDRRGDAPAVPAQEDPTRPAYETSHRLLLDPLYKGAERISFGNAGNRYDLSARRVLPAEPQRSRAG